ncbi:MAG: CapA family protein [Dehalococcoidia bacterium]|nr:CapA family protein [Dehalococcoidia bacterium]
MDVRRAHITAALAFVLIALAAGACSGSARPSSPGTRVASPTAVPPAAPTVEPVTHLLFTGDLIPARCTYAKVRALGDWTAPFQPLRDRLTRADITVGSLDATLSDAGRPIGCVETFNLAGPAAAVAGLKYAGYDVIAHAANHIKDCGVSPCGDNAMIQTDINLRGAGILTVGDGKDLAAARAPVVVERNGVRFAFLAYDDIASYYQATTGSSGSAPLDPGTVGEDIAAARRVADVVIIVPHWGVEYTTTPSQRQRDFARAAAAAGADLIVGNHPHWVQARERIGSMFVAYALGNFVFDQDWSLQTQQGALLDVTFTGTRITATQYTPVRIYDQYQPRLALPAEAAAIMQRVEAASTALAGQ